MGTTGPLGPRDGFGASTEEDNRRMQVRSQTEIVKPVQVFLNPFSARNVVCR